MSSPRLRMFVPRRSGSSTLHVIRSGIGDLDMRDRVRALGHQRAGHDADRGSRLDALRGHGPGGQIFDDAQRHRSVRDVVRADGVAIHGRVVAVRHVEARMHVLAQHAPMRLGERDLLGAEQLDLGENALLRLLDRDHPLVVPRRLKRGH